MIQSLPSGIYELMEVETRRQSSSSVITTTVDGRRGREKGHNITQIAGAEQIITEQMDVKEGRKDRRREGVERKRKEEQGRGARRKEGGKSDNSVRRGFSVQVLREEQALAR